MTLCCSKCGSQAGMCGCSFNPQQDLYTSAIGNIEIDRVRNELAESIKIANDLKVRVQELKEVNELQRKLLLMLLKDKA